MRMNIDRTNVMRSWYFRAALVLGVGILACCWAVYGPCYCLVFDTDPNARSHWKPLPSGCEVFSRPQQWDDRGDEEDFNHRGAALMGELVFRKSPEASDEVFVALRTFGVGIYSRIIPERYSKLKYRFRFPALAGRPGERIHGVAPVSEEDWSRGMQLPGVPDNMGEPEDFQGVEFTSSGARYAGKLFPKTNRFYWRRPALMTASRQRIAVFSYGSKEYKSDEVLSSDFLLPSWRSYTIDIYDVASGKRLAQVRSWACNGGDLNGFEWHGEKLASLGIANQQTLVCGFQ
jgi:hypothetical protein